VDDVPVLVVADWAPRAGPPAWGSDRATRRGGLSSSVRRCQPGCLPSDAPAATRRPRTRPARCTPTPSADAGLGRPPVGTRANPPLRPRPRARGVPAARRSTRTCSP